MRDNLLSVDWDSVLMYNLTVDTLWSAFCAVLQSALICMCRLTLLGYTLGRNPTNLELRRKYDEAHSECRRLIHEYEVHN